MSYCYRQHERLHHYVYPEEIYQHLKRSPYFIDYTEDQLQNDLKQLVEWKNLIARQETGRVYTIEEFKRRKFRYQCTPYTIEIERMVANLRQLGDAFGGSLEATLFERLLASMTRLFSEEMTPEELFRTWEDTFDYFGKLARNASDYLAHLKSDKVEEQMMTEAFLTYKQAFTQYLQNFILGMQKTSFKIEALLRNIQEEKINNIVSTLASYQMTIPRMDKQPNIAEWQASYRDQYASLFEWFLGRPGLPSELITLQNETTDTIRRIARFAQRLSERHHVYRSRRHDYLYLAGLFARQEHLEEAHKLAAMLFGVPHTRHLYGELRSSNDFDCFVKDETSTVITVQPKVPGQRERTRPGAAIERSAEKRAARSEYIAKQQEREELIDRLIHNNRIVLASLPVIDPYVRKVLLGWIARCMQREDRAIQTETGRRLKLITAGTGKRIVLRSIDGNLELPDLILELENADTKAATRGNLHGRV